MTTTDQRAFVPLVTAHIEERILAPLRRNPRATRWFVATVVSILVLHASVLGLFLYKDTSAPELVAKQEPTPIEIMVEKPQDQPKPPPQKPPDPPKPQSKQEIEKPASSAPRAPNEEKVETTELQKETHAPKTPTPPKDGKPEPSKEAASPSTQPPEPDKVQDATAAKPDVLQKDAEALDQAIPEPPVKPKTLVKPTPRAKTRRAATALDQLAGASALPDYSFARPTKKSRVYGGTEDSRYLAIVYGMIMQNRSLVDVPGADGGNVTIAFTVDDEGNLTGMELQRRSGYPQIDAAAVSAIRRASPFPPPPPGAPHGLVATIDFGNANPTYTTGSQDR